MSEQNKVLPKDEGAVCDTFAINFIEQRAQQYLQDHADTEPETGALVFQYGEAGRDYHSTLVELADDIRAALKQADDEQHRVCDVPPSGWHCTRSAGHAGPCAAQPVAASAAGLEGLTDEALIELAQSWDLLSIQDGGRVDRSALIGFVREVLATQSAKQGAQPDDVRDAVLEEAAERLDLLNDSSGDAAAYDQRDMYQWEIDREQATANCAKVIRGMKSKRTTSTDVHNQVPEELRTAVARAIWSIRRDEEDRCDMELEDMGEEHSVWAEADAAIRALMKSGSQSKGEGEKA